MAVKKTETLAPPTPRAARTLTIGFGPMSFHVGLCPIRKDRNGPSASYVCEEHHQKVTQRYWCEEGKHIVEREVDGHKTFTPARGWEYGDRFVTLSTEELHDIEDETNQTIELTNSVDSIDPVWFQNGYLLWPREDASARPYDMLAETLRTSGHTLLGKVKLWKKTHVVAIRWSGATNTLVMHFCAFDEQMRWADVASVSTGIANRGKPDPETVKLIGQFVGTLKNGVPQLKDEYAERLQTAIENAATGGVFKPAPAKTTATPKQLDEMMEALRKEVDKHSKKPTAKSRKKVPS